MFILTDCVKLSIFASAYAFYLNIIKCYNLQIERYIEKNYLRLLNQLFPEVINSIRIRLYRIPSAEVASDSSIEK